MPPLWKGMGTWQWEPEEPSLVERRKLLMKESKGTRSQRSLPHPNPSDFRVTIAALNFLPKLSCEEEINFYLVRALLFWVSLL